MLERVRRVWGHTLRESQLAATEAVEVHLKLVVRHASDRTDQRIAELPSNSSAQLRDCTTFAETIEASQKRCLHRHRYGIFVEAVGKLVAVDLHAERIRFENRLAQFFDEQRHAFTAFPDLSYD